MSVFVLFILCTGFVWFFLRVFFLHICVKDPLQKNKAAHHRRESITPSQ